MADTIFYYSDSFIGANSRDLNKTLIGVDVGSVVGFMDDAFLNCTSLVNVSLGNTAINISNNCFRGCTNLTTINIPNTVQFLGASAFQNCFNLSNVRIGSGVFQIGYNCFQNCTALSNIIIPSNVTQILDSCFLGCSNLKKIYFNGNLPYFDGLLFLGTNVNLKLYRKNFVTGWPNSFQGVPVVLWSDNVIKSGGTGKLRTKNKKASIQIIAKTTNLPPPPIPKYNLEGVYNYIGQFNGKNQYRRRAEDDPAFQYYLTFANDRWGIGLTVPPEIPQFLQTSSALGDTLYPWIPYWVFITVIQL
jgi:hypothetical protein